MAKQLFLSGTSGLGKTTSFIHFSEFGWTPKHLDYKERVDENEVWMHNDKQIHLAVAYTGTSFLEVYRHKYCSPPTSKFLYDRAPFDDIVYEYIRDMFKMYDRNWNAVAYNLDMIAGGFRQRLKNMFPTDGLAHREYMDLNIHVFLTNNEEETLERMRVRSNGIDNLHVMYITLQNVLFNIMGKHFEQPRHVVDLLTNDVLNRIFDLTTPTPPESDIEFDI